MPVSKTVITEILLRFSTGMEHQLKKPGELEGAHLVEVEYIVDDDGNILGEARNPKNHHPQPLDPDKVQPLLGEQFTTLQGQLSDYGHKLDAVTASRDELAQQLAEKTSAYDDIASRHAAAIAALTRP